MTVRSTKEETEAQGVALGRLMSEGVSLPDAAAALGLTAGRAAKVARTTACRNTLANYRDLRLDALTVRGVESAERAVTVLLQLAEDPAIPPRVRREAASDLLDRFAPVSAGSVSDAAAAGATVGALLAQMANGVGGTGR